ncbi:MAG TPA: hypothetical protein DER23_08535 [Clostridiales bacterium]|nr:hypothetical protein [Clostridiales bacterium]HCG36375.1 hypothetical protein [Clostridiales bacterium]
MKKIIRIFIFLYLVVALLSCGNDAKPYYGTWKTSEWMGEEVYGFTFAENSTGVYRGYFSNGETEEELFSYPFFWRVSGGKLFITFEEREEECYYHSLNEDALRMEISGNMMTFYRTE